jgi:predicted RNase H-like HicB family nuclease
MELTVNVHREAGSYWADVPELPGCFASGDTLDELFGSLREGVQFYIGEDDARGDQAQPLQVKSAVLSDVSTS